MLITVLLTEIDDPAKRVQGVRDVIRELPKEHHDTLEYLIYHLARVMANESTNLVSRNVMITWHRPFCSLANSMK